MNMNFNFQTSSKPTANRRPQGMAGPSAMDNYQEPVQERNNDIGADCRRWDNERGQWVKTKPMKLTELIQQTTPRFSCHPQSPGIGHPRWNSSTRIDENLYKTIPKYEVEFQKKFKARKELAASTPMPNRGRAQPLTPDSSAVTELTTKKWSEPPSFQNNAAGPVAEASTNKLSEPQSSQNNAGSVAEAPTNKLSEPQSSQNNGGSIATTTEQPKLGQTESQQQAQPVVVENADKPDTQVAKPADAEPKSITVTIDVEKPPQQPGTSSDNSTLTPNSVIPATDSSSQPPLNVSVKISFDVPADAPSGYKQTITRRL